MQEEVESRNKEQYDFWEANSFLLIRFTNLNMLLSDFVFRYMQSTGPYKLFQKSNNQNMDVKNISPNCETWTLSVTSTEIN